MFQRRDVTIMKLSTFPPKAQFASGDRVRGRDSLGIVDGLEGVVKRVRVSYPTHGDYADLTNPGIIYEVAFDESIYLLNGYQFVDYRQESFDFMSDLPLLRAEFL